MDFRWQGQRCRERIRLKPTPANLRWAERLKATIEHEIATGTFDYLKHFPDSPRAQRTLPLAATLKLSTALDNYLDSREGTLEPETLKDYRSSRDKLIHPEGLGDITLAQVTRPLLRNFVQNSPLSKSRIDHILAPLRAVMEQALDDGLVDTNPFIGFKYKRPTEGKHIIDPFTHDEVELLSQTKYGPLWKWWAWTGLRSGEVIGLRWLNVTDRQIRVEENVRLGRRKGPKTEQGRRSLALLEPALEILQSMQLNPPQPESPVWCRTGGKDWHEAKALARAFRRACTTAGVRYRYPYQLRHTFASWALSAGEPPIWVAHYMGHTDVMMIFKHYGKWIPQDSVGDRMLAAAGHVLRQNEGNSPTDTDASP